MDLVVQGKVREVKGRVANDDEDERCMSGYR
jgi:hypothetical protein